MLTFGFRLGKGDHTIWKYLRYTTNSRTNDEKATAGGFKNADTESLGERRVQEDVALYEEL